MKKTIALLMFAACSAAWAQTDKFLYRSAELKSPEDGYFQIGLSPKITNKTGKGWENLRLYDANGQETPYILRTETPQAGESVFKNYKTISHQIEKGCCTVIVIENQYGDAIDNILLQTRSFDLFKTMSVMGSDDQKQWYGVRNKWMLHSEYSSAPGLETQFVSLPNSIYKFYKITIDDNINPPIKVEALGFYTNQYRYADYAETDTLAHISQTDSTAVKKSFIDFSFPENQYIDLFKVGAEGPVDYRREAKLYAKTYDEKKKAYRYSFVTDWLLSSERSSEFTFEKMQGKEFRLEVDNQDSPPLKIRSIRAYQLKTFLAAYLKGGQPYKLYFGGDGFKAPRYDLEYFREKVLQDTGRKIMAEGFVKQAVAADKAAKTEGKGDSNIILYASLALIGILMLFMSVKMLKEMKKER